MSTNDGVNLTHTNNLAQLHRRDVELLQDPFRIADMAIELQAERMRVTETLRARDAAVHRLAEAYSSIRQKTEIIQRYEQELKNIATNLPSNESQFGLSDAHLPMLGSIIRDVRREIQLLKDHLSPKPSDQPPSYEEGDLNYSSVNAVDGNACRDSSIPLGSASISSPSSVPSELQALNNITRLLDCIQISDGIQVAADDPAKALKARHAVLASLPLPPDIPVEALKPIGLPPLLTLQDFLGAASGILKSSLGNYRVLPNVTTRWCPEREEHGFFYVPAFKCTTNPRVSTAHRWTPVDVSERMDKPTECFYNKEGLWYYAGSYEAFKIDDLIVAEWGELPHETQQAIVKDSVAGRKNTSPQNFYEVTQLYACGALKVTCVGLRCVGFNQTVYNTVLDHASKWVQPKWNRLPSGAMHFPNLPVISSFSGSSSPGPMIPTLTISPVPTMSSLVPGLPICVGNRSASVPLTRGSDWTSNTAEETTSLSATLSRPTSSPRKTSAA